MQPKFKLSLPMIAAGMLAVVLGSVVYSAERRTWTNPVLSEIQELTRLEPIQVFPRTVRVLAARDASSALDAGRPWEAWGVLRDQVFDPGASPGQVLLGARAAAGWNGWPTVRSLLRGKPWLADEQNGLGLFLLGQAEEAAGNNPAAADAYRRYLANPNAPDRAIASARLARVLIAARDPVGAADAFALAAAELPELEDWMSALRVEQEVAAGRAPGELGGRWAAAGVAARARLVQAEAQGWAARGDVNRALSRLEVEERVLRAQRGYAEAAQLRMARVDLLMRGERLAEARELLRATAAEEGILAETRLAAARALGEFPSRSIAEELAMSAAYEAASRPGLAARSLRAAILASGTPDAATQMRLARLLYDERDFGPARNAYLRAAELVTDREQLAEVELYAARSLMRGSPSRRADVLTELRRVVDRYPDTPAAGTALFLLGDLAANMESARVLYRRAAAVRSSPDAREALYRVGDRSLRLRDEAGAIAAWEDYVARYPTGEATARVAYEVGKLHASRGRQARADAMFAAAMAAEPVSYFAMRAGERLGAHPLDAVLREPRPWFGLATDPAAAAVVLRRLELLDAMGLSAEWQAEFAAARRSFESQPAALIALAEGVRDGGHAVPAINLGWHLLTIRNREWDIRLLRVVYPFLYRDLIEDESRRYGLDPMLFAGLIRQESTFRYDVKSRVGATGLSQIMPATGRGLAPSVGIRDFEVSLLEVPEVNARMGAKYLSDMLRRYGGADDLALAAYNAGPGRADRWRRELPSRDRDAFRDAIPFQETRDYVKIVLRNAEIYRRIYPLR